MRCENCGGFGTLPVLQTSLIDRDVLVLRSEFPCPSCGGTGVTHCCDGATGNAGLPETIEGEPTPEQVEQMRRSCLGALIKLGEAQASIAHDFGERANTIGAHDLAAELFQLELRLSDSAAKTDLSGGATLGRGDVTNTDGSDKP